MDTAGNDRPGSAGAPDDTATTGRAGVDRDAVRQQMREQFTAGLGGWTGMAIAALPTVVFVGVNAAASLKTAAISAVATSLVLAGVRLAMRKSPQQALSGLFGVVVAVAIASRTGEARGYFLLGIWTSFLYGLGCLASVALRRPVAGLLWEFLDPTPPQVIPRATTPPPTTPPAAPDVAPDEPADATRPVVPWYRRRPLLRAYTLATLAATVVFLARGGVQLALYHRDDTGWLAIARIAMGYPLTILAILFAIWIVRRTRKQLA